MQGPTENHVWRGLYIIIFIDYRVGNASQW